MKYIFHFSLSSINFVNRYNIIFKSSGKLSKFTSKFLLLYFPLYGNSILLFFQHGKSSTYLPCSAINKIHACFASLSSYLLIARIDLYNSLSHSLVYSNSSKFLFKV